MKPPTVIMKPSLCRSRARGSPLLIVSLPVIGHTCQPVITVGVAGRRVVMWEHIVSGRLWPECGLGIECSVFFNFFFLIQSWRVLFFKCQSGFWYQGFFCACCCCWRVVFFFFLCRTICLCLCYKKTSMVRQETFFPSMTLTRTCSTSPGRWVFLKATKKKVSKHKIPADIWLLQKLLLCLSGRREYKVLWDQLRKTVHPLPDRVPLKPTSEGNG